MEIRPASSGRDHCLGDSLGPPHQWALLAVHYLRFIFISCTTDVALYLPAYSTCSRQPHHPETSWLSSPIQYKASFQWPLKLSG